MMTDYKRTVAWKVVVAVDMVANEMIDNMAVEIVNILSAQILVQ